MKKLLEKNRSILEKRYPKVLEKLEQPDDRDQVRIEKTRDGEPVLAIAHNNRIWFLNSRLNPLRAAQIYAKRYSMRAFGTYFIFGFSDGMHIRALLQKGDKTNHIVVCEPRLDIFRAACSTFDVSDILEDERVALYLPEVTDDLTAVLTYHLHYEEYKVTEFCILPDYDILYPAECESFMDGIVNKIVDETFGRGTRILFNRMIPQFTLFHMKNMLEHRNIAQLREKIEKTDISDIPAIIVSAGPSLDKNVRELKRAEGKAFIMVVDAALRTVLKAGIHPDIVCTIDPEAPDRFFENLDLENIVWCCKGLTRPWILEHFGKKVYYYGYFEKKWNELLNETLGYEFPDLSSGGSVTSISFSLACYLGFRKIILAGQDMAFTDGVSHTAGIDGAFGDNDEYIQSRMLIKVEGIDGSLLDTDVQMWYYKQQFEKALRQNEGKLEVWNGTEGGARIEGAPNARLKDLIERECRREFDFSALEHQTEPALAGNPQGKERLARQLSEMEGQVRELGTAICEIAGYQRSILEKLEGGSSPQELKEILAEMMDRNAQLEQMPLFEMMAQYAPKESYELADHIYEKEEMSVRELVESSLGLYQGYEKAAQMLMEDIRTFI